MKKFIFSLMVLWLIPIFAFGASGACSGHGGVSCAAGPDTDGSVICVDGWRGSKVTYSSMVKCAGYSVPERKVETITVPPPVVPAPKPKVAPVKNIEKPVVEKVVPKVEKVIKVEPAKKVEVKAAETTAPKKKVGFWARFFGAR